MWFLVCIVDLVKNDLSVLTFWLMYDYWQVCIYNTEKKQELSELTYPLEKKTQCQP